MFPRNGSLENLETTDLCGLGDLFGGVKLLEILSRSSKVVPSTAASTILEVTGRLPQSSRQISFEEILLVVWRIAPVECQNHGGRMSDTK
ncbi:hypothetical protein RMSM_03827 [Rhodopirellula maiorica SM1]|uniref:Uncharacterized protein n=1 Tax=Rhodopirellula maiorica SM1 TaxID=1265738 RepID=M5RIV8_9BACT|nr:hypothetical protein RMSM_03827 [Rhodopirellula maiorica SM1]